MDLSISARVMFALVFLSAIGSAMAAGVFFAFSNFVMPALGRLSAPEAISAMNSINAKAINAWFMTLLFGTGLLCVVEIAYAWLCFGAVGTVYISWGSALYLVCSVAVTMMGNVPLNNALAKLAPTDSRSDREWIHYLIVWTRWNHVRTIGCAAAAALFIMALISGVLWYRAWGLFI